MIDKPILAGLVDSLKFPFDADRKMQAIVYSNFPTLHIQPYSS